MPLAWPGASVTSVALDAGWLATTAAAPSFDRISAKVSQAGVGLVHCTRIEPWVTTTAEVTTGRAIPASGMPASAPPSRLVGPASTGAAVPVPASAPASEDEMGAGRGLHPKTTKKDKLRSEIRTVEIGASG